MKKPYYIITAQCLNIKCDQGAFRKIVKKIIRKGADGRPKAACHAVCPKCRCWGEITNIERIDE